MAEPTIETMHRPMSQSNQALSFEQLLRRSHLRLLLRTLLAISLLFALFITTVAVSEQTREANQSFLKEIRSNAGYLRAVLADAPDSTVDAVLTHSARNGMTVPFLQIGGHSEPRPFLGLIDAYGMFTEFGLRFSFQQQLPSDYLQWIDGDRRFAAGPLRPLGTVPAHWAAAIANAPADGAIIAEPADSPLYALRFTEGGLDTLLLPVGDGRAVAVVLPRHWMTAQDTAIFAVLAFLMLWIGGFALLMPPALLLGAWQARREARVLSRPLSQLTQVVERLNENDDPPRLDPEGSQETQRLAVAFNHMVMRLEHAWDALENSRDDLQHTLDAQRELFANISHDLRTPLTAISGYAEVLERDRPELRETQVIRQEAMNMSRLVDDLFELARLESAQVSFDLRMVDIGEVLRQSKLSFTAQAWSRGVLLRLGAGIDAKGLNAYVDPQRLHQVLSNLLSNAIRHTAAGGYIELDASIDDARIRIDVIDSGEGIAEDDLPRIFDRAFRSDRARRVGSGQRHAGLGLSIARGLIEAMNGTLHAQSTLGEGSRFIIALPRVPQAG
jgi:signal transduction histidine kinase